MIPILDERSGDGSTLLVEAECDDALVLHIVYAVNAPDSDTLQVSGTTFRLQGHAEAESWVYLTLEAARKLRDAAIEIVSILEAP